MEDSSNKRGRGGPKKRNHYKDSALHIKDEY